MENCSLCNLIAEVITIRKCQHKVCPRCMVTYLQHFESAKIKCPVKECTKIVADSIIRECLSNSQLKLYDAYCYPQNIFKCLIKQCHYFIAYETLDGQFQCPNCKQPNCLSCRTLHYSTEPCHNKNQTRYELAATNYINQWKRNQIESFDQTDDLIANSDSFECPVCCNFILPRHGVSLRNCLHSFCRNCLDNSFENSRFFNQLECSICSTLLHEKERKALIGEEKMKYMTINALKTKFFNCKFADCDAIWDVGNYTGMYRCPKCKKVNCIACGDVHEKQTCEMFRADKKFKAGQQFAKKLKEKKSVSCVKCSRMLIQKGGCGALKCDNCNSDICAFTGKLVGKGGCNCTSAKPCHKDCVYGCIPESR